MVELKDRPAELHASLFPLVLLVTSFLEFPNQNAGEGKSDLVRAQKFPGAVAACRDFQHPESFRLALFHGLLPHFYPSSCPLGPSAYQDILVLASVMLPVADPTKYDLLRVMSACSEPHIPHRAGCGMVLRTALSICSYTWQRHLEDESCRCAQI